jgi:hypothetical protein
MNSAQPDSRGAFQSLWARAPWWRFFMMSGAFLTLLCLLFPPERVLRQLLPLPAAISEASYTPVVGSAQELPSASADPVKSGAQVADLSLATHGSNANDKENVSGLDTALIGRTYRDRFLVNGFNLPLPPGEWAIFANSSIKIIKDPANTGMSFFLGRIEAKRLVGAVIIHAVRSPSPSTGFEAFSRCDDAELIYAAKESVVPYDHQACWLMHTYFTPPWQQWADKAIKMASIARAAAGDMTAKGISYPQDFVAVQFFRSEKWGLLDVSYLFSPENEGIKSNVVPTLRDADWFGAHRQQYPEKVAYVNKIKDWGRSFWGRFDLAFSEAANNIGSSVAMNPGQVPAQLSQNTQPSQVDAFRNQRSVAPATHDLLVKPGETLDRIRAVYPNSPEPTPYSTAGKVGAHTLRLRDKGIWFFLEQNGTIYTIRLDAPFQGNFRGIRIGDSGRKLTQLLGPPHKKIPMPGYQEAFVYYLDSSVSANFRFDQSGAVETIFISK